MHSSMIVLMLVTAILFFLTKLIVRKNVACQGKNFDKDTGTDVAAFSALSFTCVNLILPAIDGGGVSMSLLGMLSVLYVVGLLVSILIATNKAYGKQNG